MKTDYSEFELDKGKCTCCGDISDEILIEDGRCIECIEDEKFYEATNEAIKRVNNIYNEVLFT